MGESYTATVDDVTALYWNPAGITRLDTFQWHMSLGHVAYYAETSMEHVSLVKRLGTESLLGLSMMYFSSGDMDVTTEFQPFGTGQTFRTVSTAAGLSFATALTDNFSFGLTAKYVYEGIADVKTQTILFDFGFQYNVGLANTRFAVGLNNFGPNATPNGELTHTNLEGTITYTDFETINAPSVFRLGFAWDPILQEGQRLTLSTQLNHPTDNNETFGFGAEYFWNNLLYLRAGYLFGADEKGSPSFGFGLNYKRRYGRVKIDYGFTSKELLGPIYRITLGLSLFS